MKSIVYILIAVIIGSILISAYPKTDLETKQTLTIQCLNDNPTLDMLNKSAKIIASRMQDYGIQDAVVLIDNKVQCINISIDSEFDLFEVTDLLISKGKVEFYETHDRKDIIHRFENEQELFSIMNIPLKKREVSNLNSNSVLGYSIGDNKQAIINHLNEIKDRGIKTSDINFSWSKYPTNNSEFELFLLKENFSLNGDKVSNSVGKYYDNGKADIIISFNEEGTKLWQEMTKRNIDKSIAIVIDEEVYHAPKVMFEIREGKCRISGNFTTDEANRLISLINNGELPLDFELKN